MRWLVWVAVALGIFFRVYHLDHKFYWYDEVHTSLWISGHAKSELGPTFGDREVSIHELRAFQRLDPARGLRDTVRALAEGDAQHPPLYYVLVRLWAQLSGDSVWVIRSLSVLASLLALPCIYWLTRELFLRDDVARLATALAAVSPFHVIYAQEARQYSLWTVIVLLSSIALWRASNGPTRRAWALYAVTITLALYTHLVSLLVMLAHAVYVLLRCRAPAYRSRCLLGYVAASVAGLLALAPWIQVLAWGLSRTNFAASSWGSAVVSPWRLAAMWAHNFGTVFFDADTSLTFAQRLHAGVLLSYAIQALALALTVAALYHLYRHASPAPRALLLSMAVVPLAGLGLTDLILGGIRSGGGNRYFLPSYLAVEIAVAYFLVAKLGGTPSRQRAWGFVTACVLAAGLVSCAISARAETWWTKPVAYDTPRIARVINRGQRPLVIIGATPHVLVLSHRLDDKVRVWVVGDPRAVQVPEGFTDVFVYAPARPLIEAFAEKGHALEGVAGRGALHRLVRRTTSRRRSDGATPSALFPWGAPALRARRRSCCRRAPHRWRSGSSAPSSRAGRSARWRRRTSPG